MFCNSKPSPVLLLNGGSCTSESLGNGQAPAGICKAVSSPNHLSHPDRGAMAALCLHPLHSHPVSVTSWAPEVKERSC